MDRKYIENEHVVDRYLSGDLTVREARDFEKYCLEHPEALREMPIPVRLKARYIALVKEHHPDAHGGDKVAEEKLKIINQAYATLKASYFN